MADDALARVLRLVAEGRLSADEAAPILDALELSDRPAADAVPGGPAFGPGSGLPPGPPPPSGPGTPPGPAFGATAQALRVQVSDRGRQVVNLRVPLSLGRAALERVPGISEATAERIRQAMDAGISGSIVEVDDDGETVRIFLE